MKKLTWCLFALLLIAANAQAQEIPGPTGQYVSDFADMIGQRTEDLLNARLRAYEDSTTNQIVVVTIASLGGIEPVDYATELGRQWGAGQANRDNGVVFLISRDDRKMFIAPGYGLEGELPDAEASRIIRNDIVPKFRAGDIDAGVTVGVEAVIAGIEEEVSVKASSSEGDATPIIIFLVVIAIFVLIIVIFGIVASRRRDEEIYSAADTESPPRYRKSYDLGTSVSTRKSSRWNRPSPRTSTRRADPTPAPTPTYTSRRRRDNDDDDYSRRNSDNDNDFGGSLGGGGFSGGGGSFGGGGAGGSW